MNFKVDDEVRGKGRPDLIGKIVYSHYRLSGGGSVAEYAVLWFTIGRLEVLGNSQLEPYVPTLNPDPEGSLTAR